jgi:hypothetical protein
MGLARPRRNRWGRRTALVNRRAALQVRQRRPTCRRLPGFPHQQAHPAWQEMQRARRFPSANPTMAVWRHPRLSRHQARTPRLEADAPNPWRAGRPPSQAPPGRTSEPPCRVRPPVAPNSAIWTGPFAAIWRRHRPAMVIHPVMRRSLRTHPAKTRRCRPLPTIQGRAPDPMLPAAHRVQRAAWRWVTLPPR